MRKIIQADNHSAEIQSNRGRYTDDRSSNPERDTVRIDRIAVVLFPAAVAGAAFSRRDPRGRSSCTAPLGWLASSREVFFLFVSASPFRRRSLVVFHGLEKIHPRATYCSECRCLIVYHIWPVTATSATMHRIALHRKLVLEHYCQLPSDPARTNGTPSDQQGRRRTRVPHVAPPRAAFEWLELAPATLTWRSRHHEESRGGWRWRGDGRSLRERACLTGIFTGVPWRPVCMLSACSCRCSF